MRLRPVLLALFFAGLALALSAAAPLFALAVALVGAALGAVVLWDEKITERASWFLWRRRRSILAAFVLAALALALSTALPAAAPPPSSPRYIGQCCVNGDASLCPDVFGYQHKICAFAPAACGSTTLACAYY